ncbi:unnamed protein product [Zymoseptoria tritici ST99CH_3D7]|uniref:Uncharacterized protein n=2 Tax=Zymoseptoria tritici TaxID=1047171 RepID=A0A1X7RZN6_ZYMT9|nr:unnamed protein product [Zymoseptoria tritici ST99CH_3D7]SMR55722.1 unnamed protein product [Zymoseptoria tritici ST99CH_1E4]
MSLKSTHPMGAMNKIAKNTSNRKNPNRKDKLEYPPNGYQAPGNLLRVHSPEDTTRNHGRVLQVWTLCRKPWNAPNNGCRSAHRNFYVWHHGVLREVWKCVRDVCDWDGHEAEEDEEGDGDGDDGDEAGGGGDDTGGGFNDQVDDGDSMAGGDTEEDEPGKGMEEMLKKHNEAKNKKQQSKMRHTDFNVKVHKKQLTATPFKIDASS